MDLNKSDATILATIINYLGRPTKSGDQIVLCNKASVWKGSGEEEEEADLSSRKDVRLRSIS